MTKKRSKRRKIPPTPYDYIHFKHLNPRQQQEAIRQGLRQLARDDQ